LTNAQLASAGSVLAGLLLLVFVSRRKAVGLVPVQETAAAEPTA
jgi:hypothetical protein